MITLCVVLHCTIYTREFDAGSWHSHRMLHCLAVYRITFHYATVYYIISHYTIYIHKQTCLFEVTITGCTSVSMTRS